MLSRMEEYVVPHMFVICGACNILLIKWVDMMQGECKDGQRRHFQHPVLQTALMFLGEFLCFILYKVVYWLLQRHENGSVDTNVVTQGERQFPVMKLLFPTVCDSIASLMLFISLYLTYATSFQMIREVTVIFVGIFSSIYLNQTLILRHWLAMLTMVASIIMLISMDMYRIYYDAGSIAAADANAILTADLLIVCAEIFHAAQFVYEEKYVKELNVPALQAIGWQGIFGIPITLMMGAVLTFVPAPSPLNGNSRAVFDDLFDIWPQLQSNTLLVVPLGIFCITSACYNFAALTILKVSSSSNRALSDGVRLLSIWIFVLLFEWEKLNITILVPFVLLAIGTITYRNAIFLVWYRSLMTRLLRMRYVNLSEDTHNDVPNTPISRPADVI